MVLVGLCSRCVQNITVRLICIMRARFRFVGTISPWARYRSPGIFGDNDFCIAMYVSAR